ncbi:hypothetical protein [Ancylobacter mangrovi]|uniref:hypothetical protein n=1 Tax=Ancylobacter mangrovi TaxID=2972472 RepID=UPI002161699B|nr:hypothetical protein [Ancylobacter mangrovi]MCS0501638.1 hypothetical protein [Ancylobacter mangrovi]
MIERQKIVKDGSAWRPSPDDLPATARHWTGFSAFIPGDVAAIRKQVEAVRISFAVEVMPAEGGTWVTAGFSGMERIVAATRPG